MVDIPKEQLQKLFTNPSPPPSNFGLTPSRLPGSTFDSTKALLECLQDNHLKQHIFFNDKQFHNHATHHLYAIYAMGADRKLLNAAYQTHVVYQRPAFESPGSIDDGNWKDHLGDERYYQAYVAFFSTPLLSGGPTKLVENAAGILDKYVLSKDANVVPGKSKEAPHLLARFLGGFLHPLIHAGYGAEFGSAGMWAEGLAEACVQSPTATNLFIPSLFDVSSSGSGITGVISQVASLSLFSGAGQKASTHALSILGKVAKDPDFAPSKIGIPDPKSSMEKVVTVCEEKLLNILGEWTVAPAKEDLQKKLKEIMWMNTVIYTIGGWAGRNQGKDEHHEFNADFLLMHLVTSAIFLPSFLSHLSYPSGVLLLRTYFLISLALYIARGRPALPIAEFYNSVTSTPQPPGPHPKPAEKTYKEDRSAGYDTEGSQKVWLDVSDQITPNPWLPIVQTTLVHPNEHLCKLQRSLLHFANIFGETAPGEFGSVRELEGAEFLDGTLFIRAAGLTANRLGWMREGQAERRWDMDGFF